MVKGDSLLLLEVHIAVHAISIHQFCLLIFVRLNSQLYIDTSLCQCYVWAQYF